MNTSPRRCFLFLQGLATRFFERLGSALLNRGHAVHRVNFNGGDRAFWQLSGAIDFRRREHEWPEFLDQLLVDRGVSDIVLFGDCRPLHRAAIRLAETRGVRVHVVEEGYLRPGWITAAEIEAALGTALAAPPADAPRAPGTLAAHYAPRTPLALAEGNLALQLAASLARQGKRVAVLARATARPLQPGIEWHIAPPDAAGYAHALYSCLRRLDEAGCDAIVVEKPPQAPEWAAINDRLARAAAGSSDGDET